MHRELSSDLGCRILARVRRELPLILLCLLVLGWVSLRVESNHMGSAIPWSDVPRKVQIIGRLKQPLCTLCEVTGQWVKTGSRRSIDGEYLAFRIDTVNGKPFAGEPISQYDFRAGELSLSDYVFPDDRTLFNAAAEGDRWTVDLVEAGKQECMPVEFFKKYDSMFPQGRFNGHFRTIMHLINIRPQGETSPSSGSVERL